MLPTKKLPTSLLNLKRLSGLPSPPPEVSRTPKSLIQDGDPDFAFARRLFADVANHGFLGDSVPRSLPLSQARLPHQPSDAMAPASLTEN
jgi:hypothetical protein